MCNERRMFLPVRVQEGENVRRRIRKQFLKCCPDCVLDALLVLETEKQKALERCDQIQANVIQVYIDRLTGERIGAGLVSL